MKKNLWISLLLIWSTYLPSLLFAKSLPQLPVYLESPFTKIKNQETFSSAIELERYFEKEDYSLDIVRKELRLRELYVANLPTDLNKLSVPHKTSLFIRLLLTSVVKANRDILAVRKELNTITAKKKNSLELSTNEQQWLEAIGDEYEGNPNDLQELLERVDILPIGLILAQAIDESGWGTSHFAITGNALYGQHLAKNSKGTFLITPDGHVRVASFENIFLSTASYIHNLNTTKAYARLRVERAEIRRRHGKLSGDILAGALIHYSALGQHYVDTLRWLIKHYKLDELDNIQLDSHIPPTLITFTR